MTRVVVCAVAGLLALHAEFNAGMQFLGGNAVARETSYTTSLASVPKTCLSRCFAMPSCPKKRSFLQFSILLSIYFEDMRFMKRSREIELVEFNRHVFKKLTSEDMLWIREHCDRKLAEYYSRYENE